MEKVDPSQQPDLTVCPENFCFFWEEEGDYVARGMHESPEKAMEKLVRVNKRQCGFHYGLCVRNKQVAGVKDFYEPCEPRLRKAGLPDFYFDDPKKYKSLEDRKIYNAHFGTEEDFEATEENPS